MPANQHTNHTRPLQFGAAVGHVSPEKTNLCLANGIVIILQSPGGRSGGARRSGARSMRRETRALSAPRF